MILSTSQNLDQIGAKTLRYNCRCKDSKTPLRKRKREIVETIRVRYVLGLAETMEVLALQLGGTVLGLVGPLKIVRDYLKGYAESRKVGNQLKNALQSLNLYEDSIRASELSGKTLYAKIDGVVLPMSLHDAEDLILLMTQFDNNFSDVLSSVVMFGKECNFLISGAVEGFMETVKTRKPEVHDL